MSWQRNRPGTTWYEFTCAYVDMKWKTASAKYRRAIAQALASATLAMLADTSGTPDGQVLRSALVNWGYNTSSVLLLRTTSGTSWAGWRAIPGKSKSWQILP